MIKFKIIESSDYDSLGEFKFKLNRFTIGDKKQNHLIIFDSYLLKHSMQFRIKNNSLFTSSSNEG